MTLVVGFDGAPIVGETDIKVHDADGELVGVFVAVDGRVDVALPAGVPLSARAQHLEDAPGTYEGEPYEVVDHWASTSTSGFFLPEDEEAAPIAAA